MWSLAWAYNPYICHVGALPVSAVVAGNMRMCEFTMRKEAQMSKRFAAVVAGLFTASAFAADAPKTAPAAAAEAKPAVEAAAPAKPEAKPVKAHKRTHKTTRQHAGGKAKTETPATTTK